MPLGTGLADGVEVLELPGGNLSGQKPLSVAGVSQGASYFNAHLVRIDPGADMTSTPYRFFSQGVSGGDDVEGYVQGGRLYQRHGSVANISGAGVLAAGQAYLVWFSFDATLGKATMGVNSATPLVLATDAITLPGGLGEDFCCR